MGAVAASTRSVPSDLQLTEATTGQAPLVKSAPPAPDSLTQTLMTALGAAPVWDKQVLEIGLRWIAQAARAALTAEQEWAAAAAAGVPPHLGPL